MTRDLPPVKRNILLNPGPATTTDTVKYAQVVPDICPREKDFGRVVEGILAGLLKVVHGEGTHRCVLFGGSGTAVMDAVINSVVPHDGGILVVSNGAYGTRMIEIAESYGISCVRYEIPYGDYPDPAAAENLIKRNRTRLSHIGIIHHETTTGMLNPIEAFLELARKYGLEIIVDTVSSFAGVPIDLRRTDYDHIFSTSNKCIQGMAGAAFAVSRTGALERSRSVKKRSYYLNLHQQDRSFQKTGQMQFTPPVQVLYALDRAIREYFEEGGEARRRRYVDCWEGLVAGLEKIGFRLLLPRDQQSKLLTAVIEPDDPRYRFEDMHDYLYAGDFTIYPGKGAKKETFRIANIGDIRRSDIESFLSVLKQYVDERGIARF